jgi:dethiobiotin synthetase
MGIVFITGTDTNVGKTWFTALWLHHLRRRGERVFAMKPFASGGRDDAELFHGVMEGELSLDEINPYYFAAPLAPAVAARAEGVQVPLATVVERIMALERRCDCLLVEGAGGLLAPLGEGYCARDLIAALRCRVLIVAANRLGVINHTRLTVEALGAVGEGGMQVVLNDIGAADKSVGGNLAALQACLAPARIIEWPTIETQLSVAQAFASAEKKLKKALVQLKDFATFTPARSGGGQSRSQSAAKKKKLKAVDGYGGYGKLTPQRTSNRRAGF